MYKAACVLSGMKRFIPRARRHLDTASLYYANWAKITSRKRALPLKGEWARAFAAYAFARDKASMALLVLVGFFGFFRIQELLRMQFSQLLFASSELCYVVLADSKGAKLKGQPEHVKLLDQGVLAALQRLSSKHAPYDLIFPLQYAEVLSFLKEAATFFGLPAELATSHCLRRGGATWHFLTFESLDLTADHGRWRHIQSCRTYINQAMADLAEISLSDDDRSRIAGAAKALPAALCRIGKG